MTNSIDHMAKEVMKLINTFILGGSSGLAGNKRENEKCSLTPDAFDSRINSGSRKNVPSERRPSF